MYTVYVGSKKASHPNKRAAKPGVVRPVMSGGGGLSIHCWLQFNFCYMLFVQGGIFLEACLNL